MTTKTQMNLTPSQAAFKFLNNLFLDPVLLAAYAEKCWSLNGAKNANEILTGWLEKLGYPGASPGLIYQVLQFWQSRSLWLWQGEYNQNFYYPPDGAQVNQYSLKILGDENGDISVTLNGEALTYSLAIDENYLILSWSGSGGNSAEGSVTFYYSPNCLLSENSIVQYSGNFFNGFLNGNPFKGALLTQTPQEPNPSQHPWYDVFWTDTAKVVEIVVVGVLVVGGYGLVAKRKGYWPFRKPNKALELSPKNKGLLDRDGEDTLEGDPEIRRAMDLGTEDIQLKSELKALMDAEQGDNLFGTLFFKTQDLAAKLGLNTQDLAMQYSNLREIINNELDLDSLDSTELRRIYASIDNETTSLTSKYKSLRKQLRSVVEKENSLEPKNLVQEPPTKLANELVQNQETAQGFQADPDRPLNVNEMKTLEGLDQELKVGADDDLDPEEILDQVEVDALEDGADA